MLKQYLDNDLPPFGLERGIVLTKLTAFHERLQAQTAKLINDRRLSTNHPKVQALSDAPEKVSRKLYDEEGL